MKKIKLSQGEWAMVDDEDFEWLNYLKWYACRDRNKLYARNCQGSMHRVIMDNPKNSEVDHIDGNGLNNQRKNLRICTRGENARNRGKQTNNTSGLKGVSWKKRENKWVAQIKLNSKSIHLGLFTDKKEAADAYKKASKKYHGKFANYG